MDETPTSIIPDSERSPQGRRELDRTLGAERQRRFARFLMAAMSGVPWVGSLIGAAGALSGEGEQEHLNDLHREWIAAHEDKLKELAATLIEIIQRLDSFGTDVHARLESPEYLSLVRQAFRVWDQAETAQKRDLVKKLLMNAGGTTLCPDDLVRLFLQWIDYYHEAHFAVVRVVFQNPGATRSGIWDEMRGTDVTEDSAEADLFKLLVRELSTGGVIRQERATTAAGEFVRKPASGHRRSAGARVMKSAFDDTERYELTGLGRQFVHYVMNELVPWVAGDTR